MGITLAKEEWISVLKLSSAWIMPKVRQYHYLTEKCIEKKAITLLRYVPLLSSDWMAILP